jgi:magnesium chelatase accessory protein
MTDRLVWERDGSDWPNRNASRFVTAAGLRWHVQQMGSGPALLLLHGTGAATHSWRELAPMLAPHFNVVAPDLPGHGFTESPPPRQLSLPGMAAAITALLQAIAVEPTLVVGHSAGAAILARMCLDGAIAPRYLVSINGALLPLGGLPGRLFSPLAKLLAVNPLVPRLFAWRATNRSAVQRLISGTGSSIDAQGVEFYRRLVSNPGHAAAALGMMANWDLRSLEHELPRLKTPLILVSGSRDRTLPPSEVERVHALVPGAKVVSLRGLGHLAHEEQPQAIADLLIGLFRSELGSAAN